GPTPPDFPAIPSNGEISFASIGGQVSGVHIRPTRQTLPTIDTWNVTVQRQVTNSLSAEVSYVGTKGTHGFAGDGPNYDVNPVSMPLFGVIDPHTGEAYSQNQRHPLFRLDPA